MEIPDGRVGNSEPHGENSHLGKAARGVSVIDDLRQLGEAARSDCVAEFKLRYPSSVLKLWPQLGRRRDNRARENARRHLWHQARAACPRRRSSNASNLHWPFLADQDRGYPTWPQLHGSPRKVSGTKMLRKSSEFGGHFK